MPLQEMDTKPSMIGIDAFNSITKLSLLKVYCFIFFLQIISELVGEKFNSFLIGDLVYLFTFLILLKKYLFNKGLKLSCIFGKKKIDIIYTLKCLFLNIFFKLYLVLYIYFFMSYYDENKLLSILNKKVGLTYSLAFLLSAIIIVPFCEEVLYRGIILNTLSKLGVKKALLITTMIFSLLHGRTFYLQLFSGYLYGYIYIKTNSLYSSILLHMLSNSLLIPIMVYWNKLFFLKELTFVRGRLLFFIVLSTLFLFVYKKLLKEMFMTKTLSNQ